MRIRETREDDVPRLYEIHREALGPYVQETWGWDEEFQSSEFRRRGAGANRRVIEEDGVVAGFIDVEERSDRIVLRTIELASAFQRRGIGTALIRELVERAGRSGVPVQLRVLKCNPARTLYERLGFHAVGETETHLLMQTRREG